MCDQCNRKFQEYRLIDVLNQKALSAKPKNNIYYEEILEVKSSLFEVINKKKKTKRNRT